MTYIFPISASWPSSISFGRHKARRERLTDPVTQAGKKIVPSGERGISKKQSPVSISSDLSIESKDALTKRLPEDNLQLSRQTSRSESRGLPSGAPKQNAHATEPHSEVASEHQENNTKLTEEGVPDPSKTPTQKTSGWNKKKVGLALFTLPLAAFLGRTALARYGYNFNIPIVDPLQEALKSKAQQAYKATHAYFNPMVPADCDTSIGRWLDRYCKGIEEDCSCRDMQGALEKVDFPKNINYLTPEDSRALKTSLAQSHPDKPTGSNELFRSIRDPIKGLLKVLKDFPYTYRSEAENSIVEIKDKQSI